MRILLLSLPSLYEDQPFYPLGIGYLMGSLRGQQEAQALHLASMLDARAQITARLQTFQPQVVALTCTTFNRVTVARAIRWVRAFDRSIRIVVGGVHATYCADQVLSTYGADVVVIGEGEITLPELLRTMESGAHLHDVSGIAFLDGTGNVVRTPPRPPIAILDDLPSPDYEYAAASIRSFGIGFLITTRGCPVRCEFCSTSSYWGQQVRMHSAERVVDEMQKLQARFGVSRLFFHDDTFNVGIKRVNEICAAIQARGLKIEWGCQCRVTPVSEAMLANMVAAGCRHICWGIESGSPRMLTAIHKKITVEQVRQAFELCRPYQDRLSTGAFVMVGNPGENDESIRETTELLSTLPLTDPIGTSILYVLPGTLLFERAKQAGQICDADWLRYDTVPVYTMENSYWKLLRWTKLINRSIHQIPFDPKRHLWRRETPSDASTTRDGTITLRLRYKWQQACRVAKGISKLLPRGRIRF